MDEPDKRSGKSRTRILKAARTTIARLGMDETTIRKVADEAGVSPALVMQHFRSKAALVHEIFLDSNTMLLALFKERMDGVESFFDLTMSALDALLARDLRYPGVTRQVMAFTWSWGPEEEEKFRTTLRDMSAIIADSLATRFMPKDPELARAASFTLINTYVGLLRIALQEDWAAERVREAIKPSVHLILAGLDALAQKTDAPLH